MERLWVVLLGERQYLLARDLVLAELAGVPDPVVSRAETVLDRLRREKAIEARGGSSDGTVQTTFDLGRGEFTDSATDGEESGEQATDAASDSVLDDDIEAVLDDLRATDVNETPPVELMAAVQTWQEQLEE